MRSGVQPDLFSGSRVAASVQSNRWFMAASHSTGLTGNQPDDSGAGSHGAAARGLALAAEVVAGEARLGANGEGANWLR